MGAFAAGEVQCGRWCSAPFPPTPHAFFLWFMEASGALPDYQLGTAAAVFGVVVAPAGGVMTMVSDV